MDKTDKNPKYIIVVVGSEEELRALTSFSDCRVRCEKGDNLKTEWFPAKMDEEKNAIHMTSHAFKKCLEYINGGHLVLQ